MTIPQRQGTIRENPEISTETIEQQTKPESKPPKTDKAETQPTGTKTPASKQTSVKQPIILKDLGEGIEEANILKIAVKKGDEIKEGAILIELETDKSTIEIPSDFAGKVESIAIKEGDKIKTGQEILTISIVSSETTFAKEEPTAEKPTENKPTAEKPTAEKNPQPKNTQKQLKFPHQLVLQEIFLFQHLLLYDDLREKLALIYAKSKAHLLEKEFA